MVNEGLEGSWNHTVHGGKSFRSNQTGITTPYWLKVERDIAGNFKVSHSANGTTWQAVTGATPQNIQMGSSVYVGLVLISHDAAQTCEVVFSNVAISNADGVPAVVARDDPAAATIDTRTEWRIRLQEFADRGNQSD